MQETSNQIQQLRSEIKTVKSDNQKLHEQLQIAREELQKRVSNSLAQSPVPLSTSVDTPVDMNSTRDSEALRRSADRVLAKLKVGRQSTAGKAIDAFIKELRHLETAKSASQIVTTPGEQKRTTWEARADDFLLEVAGNG